MRGGAAEPSLAPLALASTCQVNARFVVKVAINYSMSAREFTGEKGSCLSMADELQSLGAMCRQTVLALSATYAPLSEVQA
jgi:hypothetical protein